MYESLVNYDVPKLLLNSVDMYVWYLRGEHQE